MGTAWTAAFSRSEGRTCRRPRSYMECPPARQVAGGWGPRGSAQDGCGHRVETREPATGDRAALGPGLLTRLTFPAVLLRGLCAVTQRTEGASPRTREAGRPEGDR